VKDQSELTKEFITQTTTPITITIIDTTKLPTTETKVLIRETTIKEIREMPIESKLYQDLP